MPGRPLLLVVDDNEQLRSACAAILTREAYRVLTASDGASAFDVLSEANELVDLMVVDLRLPDMGGQEFVRRTGLPVPVLYISGDELAIRHRAAISSYALLEKPFELGELLDRVAYLLGERAGPRPLRPPPAA